MSTTHYQADLVATDLPRLRYRFTANFLEESPSYGIFEVSIADWKYEVQEAGIEPEIAACVAGLVAKLRRLLRETSEPPKSLKLIA